MKTFKDFSLSEPVSKALSELGFDTPTPIQAQALPILLKETTDFLGLAATGTGKTGAFGIPLIERLHPTKKGIQALILCPTRELALQISGQIDLLGKYRGIKALPIYGGTGYGDQIYGLKRGAQIIVGTPGRIIDHMEKGTLNLDHLDTLILDEADEMISMGFKDDLELILSSTPKEKKMTWLFSATMSPEVRRVADTYLKNPKQVQVNRTEMLPTTVEQIYYFTQESLKPEVLCKLIDHAEDFYGIIFCQTKALVTELNQLLTSRGYRSDCLHGDMDQTSRDRTMRGFRERKFSVLVATDVACRGLDVKDITHVINYSLPRELDNYVHRIGRTGRSGKSGFAMSLVTSSHKGLIGRIEKMTRTKMREGNIPTRKEIGIKLVGKLLEKFESEKASARATALLNEEWKTKLATLTPEEVASRFIAMMHPDLFIEKAKAQKPSPQVISIPGHTGAPKGAAPKVVQKPSFSRWKEERPSSGRSFSHRKGQKRGADQPNWKRDGSSEQRRGPREGFRPSKHQ